MAYNYVFLRHSDFLEKDKIFSFHPIIGFEVTKNQDIILKCYLKRKLG